MKFSEAWLRAMCDPPISSTALCERLTMAGLEVEEAAPAAPPFDRVVVARIEKVEPHPNADRLRVCTVDVGTSEKLGIVCGAPNAAPGMNAPCALEGAILPGGLAIRRATMRGVESRGMLCSAKELRLDEDASGLLALDPSLAPGTSLRDALALDDTLITLKITPNRADCLCVSGIAQDVAAITRAPLALPKVEPANVTFDGVRPVRVEDPEACPRFCGRLIDGIDPAAPSPAWMVQRLARSGIRSISAVVDITNYVMLELGQPLHAYDDRLLDGSIVVRFAREGEKLTLLNEQVLDLTSDLLLVADEGKPLGLAGIMGGEHSGIAADTKRVYLEGAFWSPAVIQGKMRRLGFTSDAGYRFERGVDFDGCARAVERATQLILEICGGRAGPLTDAAVPTEYPARDPVRVRTSRIERLLGTTIADETIGDVFTRLALPFTREDGVFVVTPPARRFDLAIEEDFVEEVARIHGYDRIPATPRAHVDHMLPDSETVRSRSAIKRALADLDWQEVVTFSFVSSGTEAALDSAAVPIKVLNPIAAHLDVMRTSLLPGLLETLRTNVNRKAARVRIFEAGRVFLRHDPGYDQPLRIGGLAFGPAVPEQWGEQPTRDVDFFDVKGDLASLAAPHRLATERHAYPALHPGRSARVVIDGRPAGFLGELHPRLVRHFDLPKAPIVFELALEDLTNGAVPAGRALSKLPVVRRDLALVVDEAVPAQSLLDALERAKPPHVISIGLFDVYRGRGLTDGRKSLAILVLMQDTSRTLTDADIDATEALLLSVARDQFGATLRQ
ncbi:MAG TPA: phenylalanine--tRNA ligase subunit beta [Casimicrobiaceae bacterium]|nr:phenylalanine--tRNA ligase subunit beta [Casimicrobiaceae bacterium]